MVLPLASVDATGVTGRRAIGQLTGLILAAGTVGVAVGMEQVGALIEGSEIGRTGVIE